MISRRKARPTELVRVGDRVSFLYLERCVVHRDSNAITATDERGTVHIPAGSVSVLLLGPGTTISQPAVTLMADSGATVVWTGERGVRYYAHGQPLAASTRLLEAQAAAVSNPRSRLRVARTMYELRFPDEDVSRLTMQQLRGREGARVRRAYRAQAERTGVEWKGRSYDFDNWGGGDAVNQALSAANSALYGVVHAVIVGLGCSPGLGFIHTGHQRAFVYDIADLYKTELTIPVAFEVAAEAVGSIGSEVRRRVRDRLHDGKLLDRCARDIQYLLLGHREEDSAGLDDVDSASLWDGAGRTVPGGVSYGAEF